MSTGTILFFNWRLGWDCIACVSVFSDSNSGSNLFREPMIQEMKQDLSCLFTHSGLSLLFYHFFTTLPVVVLIRNMISCNAAYSTAILYLFIIIIFQSEIFLNISSCTETLVPRIKFNHQLKL